MLRLCIELKLPAVGGFLLLGSSRVIQLWPFVVPSGYCVSPWHIDAIFLASSKCAPVKASLTLLNFSLSFYKSKSLLLWLWPPSTTLTPILSTKYLHILKRIFPSALDHIFVLWVITASRVLGDSLPISAIFPIHILGATLLNKCQLQL